MLDDSGSLVKCSLPGIHNMLTDMRSECSEVIHSHMHLDCGGREVASFYFYHGDLIYSQQYNQ